MAIWRVKFSSHFCTHWDKNKGKHLCIYNVRERGCFSQRRQTSVFASALTPIEQLSSSTSKDQLLPKLLLLRRLLHTSHSATQAFLPVSHSDFSSCQPLSHSGFSSSQPLSHSGFSSCQPLSHSDISCQPLTHSTTQDVVPVSHSGFLRVSHSATQDLEWLSG